MSDFCFQCNLEMGFGAYSDFDHFGKAGGILCSGDQLVVAVLCEGCGPTYVDHKGRCVDVLCTLHTTEGSREVLRRAEDWVARRSGPLRIVYRSWDWWNGTPWDPGQKHFLRWKWLEFKDKMTGRDHDPFDPTR